MKKIGMGIVYPPDVQLHVYDDDWVIDTNKYKCAKLERVAGIGGAASGSTSRIRRSDE